uniref:Small ribosomal subunit protein eS28 n=1 Tax=Varanus komodoensis TaxID=61221 RepID=A0A8D2LAV9_VARKO
MDTCRVQPIKLAESPKCQVGLACKVSVDFLDGTSRSIIRSVKDPAWEGHVLMPSEPEHEAQQLCWAFAGQSPDEVETLQHDPLIGSAQDKMS